MPPRAVMVGPPGAGKSTIGRKLARFLEVEACDTDAEIERLEKRPIPEIFVEDGEAAFRAREEEVVAQALAECDGVVCLGGGAILSERTRGLLRQHSVIYLDITESEGLLRTGITGRLRRGETGKKDVRPLLAGPDPAGRYRALLKERRPLYEEVASLTVHTDRRSPGKVVREIAAAISPPGAVGGHEYARASRTGSHRGGGEGSQQPGRHTKRRGRRSGHGRKSQPGRSRSAGPPGHGPERTPGRDSGRSHPRGGDS